MKKILIALTIVISCLGISNVKAADLQLVSQDGLDKFHEVFTDEEFSNNINNLITEYKEKYYYSHPYYAIKLIYYPKGLRSDYSFLIFQLYYYNELPDFKYYGGGNYGSYYGAYLGLTSSSSGIIYFAYSSLTGDNDDYVLDDSNQYSSIQFPLFYIDHNANPHRSEFYPIYFSNFDLTLTSLNKFPDNCFLTKTYDNILVPTFIDSTPYRLLSLSSDFNYHFDNLYDYDDKYNTDVFPTPFTEINLNNYSYVILTLKNYEVEPFSTTIQVKGQFCPTPVYHLGTHSSEEAFGSPVKDICTPYYDTYTPYKLNYYSDYLEYFAMIYVKSYDTSKDNYIKVDNRMFGITYVSEEEKDSPLVHYQGNTIQTIPYDKLPSTSTLNTQIGYVPDYGNSFSFDGIFTEPLKFLTGIWSTIVSFFSLITSFISLLPMELQGFLFASFTLAVAIGIIKIIL